MFSFFGKLLAKVVAFARFLADCFVQVFVDAWELLTDVPVWCFDQVMGVAVAAVGSLDLDGFDQWTETWRSLPAEVANAVVYLGGVEAGAIVLTAIGIRLVLQLIPFTRLGS